MSDKKEDKAVSPTNEETQINEEKSETIDLAKVNQQLAEENQALKLQLDKLKTEQRKLLLAEKDNTLKEQEIRNEEFKRYANQRIIKESIVSLLLELERALNFKTDNRDVQNFLKGFEYIFSNFKVSLKAQGLEAITEKVGNQFDSTRNQIVDEIAITEETKEQKDNMIAEVVLSGYKLYDRVISPVQVKIYKLPKKNDEKEKTK